MTALVQAEIDGDRLDDRGAQHVLRHSRAWPATRPPATSSPTPCSPSSSTPTTRPSWSRASTTTSCGPPPSRRCSGGAARSTTSAAPPPATPRSAAQPIKEGDKVVMYYASANRDADVFEDPHGFDIRRTPNDHVTFGGGGVALLPRRQPGPRRDQGDDARVRRAAYPTSSWPARRAACASTSSTASSRCPSASTALTTDADPPDSSPHSTSPTHPGASHAHRPLRPARHRVPDLRLHPLPRRRRGRVSKAGGFGVLGAVGFTPEQLEIELDWIDEHIGDKPYGVDIVIPGKYEGMGEMDPDKLERRAAGDGPGRATASSPKAPRRPRRARAARGRDGRRHAARLDRGHRHARRSRWRCATRR